MLEHLHRTNVGPAPEAVIQEDPPLLMYDDNAALPKRE